MKVGIIGKGKWGTNIVRTLQELNVPYVICQEPRNENAVARFLNTPHLSHVVLAVPPTIQPRYALWIMNDRGLPCFLEKPLALHEEEAREIQATAHKWRVPVLVDFVWLWHPAFMELKKRTVPGEIRNIWTSSGDQGPFRESHNGLWDWAPHDLAMVMELLKSTPTQSRIARVTWDNSPSGIWHIFLRFGSDTRVIINTGSGYHEKNRRLEVHAGAHTFCFNGVLNSLTHDEAPVPFTYTPPLQLALSEFLKCERSDLQPYAEHTTLSLAVQITHILSGGK